jgi:hypothetical protein
MNKVCKHCNLEKDLKQFPLRGKKEWNDNTPLEKRRTNVCRKCKRTSTPFCHDCRTRPRVNKTRCEICRDKQRQRRVSRQARDREAAFAHYGHKCAYCQESREIFLSIDHINNDGGKHRREDKVENIYVWLRQNSYPVGFQTACFNCNMAKGIYGEATLLAVLNSVNGDSQAVTIGCDGGSINNHK